ncbi:hypothetical protein KY5_4982 [Streptomyces formicae]|uniref:Uncharacterized protein n=1 Tax=Streptomyces formicae TaxID=1616117 RepID=A0A291QDW2_9ACTN|nr:hypothetical protein KY5_4982 [Streptomyces formicae]
MTVGALLDTRPACTHRDAHPLPRPLADLGFGRLRDGREVEWARRMGRPVFTREVDGRRCRSTKPFKEERACHGPSLLIVHVHDPPGRCGDEVGGCDGFRQAGCRAPAQLSGQRGVPTQGVHLRAAQPNPSPAWLGCLGGRWGEWPTRSSTPIRTHRPTRGNYLPGSAPTRPLLPRRGRDAPAVRPRRSSPHCRCCRSFGLPLRQDRSTAGPAGPAGAFGRSAPRLLSRLLPCFSPYPFRSRTRS